eukprot:412820-Rhodomonas_salina.2
MVVDCNRLQEFTSPSSEPHSSEDEYRSANSNSIKFTYPGQASSRFDESVESPTTTDANMVDTNPEPGDWGKLASPPFMQAPFLLSQTLFARTKMTAVAPSNLAYGSFYHDSEICRNEDVDVNCLSDPAGHLELDPVDAVCLFQRNHYQHPGFVSQIETTLDSDLRMENGDANSQWDQELLQLDPLEAVCLFQSHRLHG